MIRFYANSEQFESMMGECAICCKSLGMNAHAFYKSNEQNCLGDDVADVVDISITKLKGA